MRIWSDPVIMKFMLPIFLSLSTKTERWESSSPQTTESAGKIKTNPAEGLSLKTKKRPIMAAVLLLLIKRLFCSFRQVADALGTQCLFHQFTVFENGDTLKIRMERPVRRALWKAFGVSKSRYFTACFTFCHFVQFLSYLWSALFQLQIYFSLSFPVVHPTKKYSTTFF